MCLRLLQVSHHSHEFLYFMLDSKQSVLVNFPCSITVTNNSHKCLLKVEQIIENLDNARKSKEALKAKKT